MSHIKVRGVICNLHGGMNASSQLQPCNFQKRRSHLRSKHSVLVSLYDCCCALMYFSTPLSFVQQNGTYCSVVRHLVVRSKTVPSPCYSLEVEKILKKVFFSSLVLHFVFYTWCTERVYSPFKDKRLSWQQHVSCFSVFTLRWGRFTDLNREEQTKRLMDCCRSLERALWAGTLSRQKTSECSKALTVWCWTGTWW